MLRRTMGTLNLFLISGAGGVFFPLECFCSVSIKFCFLGTWPQRKGVLVAAEQKDYEHSTGGGTRSQQGRNSGNSHQKGAAWWPQWSALFLMQELLWHPCLQNWCGWHDAFALQGLAPWGVQTMPPVSKPSPTAHLRCFCSTQRYMKWSWKNYTGFI